MIAVNGYREPMTTDLENPPLCEAMCGLEIQVEGGRVAGHRRPMIKVIEKFGIGAVTAYTGVCPSTSLAPRTRVRIGCTVTDHTAARGNMVPPCHCPSTLIIGRR